MQLAVAELLVRIDVGAVVDRAAEQDRPVGPALAAADQLLRVGGVEAHVGDDLPCLGPRLVTHLPTRQVFAVEQRRPAAARSVVGGTKGRRREGQGEKGNQAGSDQAGGCWHGAKVTRNTGGREGTRKDCASVFSDSPSFFLPLSRRPTP